MRKRADKVLTEAFLRASKLLGLSGSQASRVLGISEQSLSRLNRRERIIKVPSKKAEIALLILRVYEGLDRLVGRNATQRLAWMRSYDHALNGYPSNLVQSIQGLVGVVAYLDAMRTAH